MSKHRSKWHQWAHLIRLTRRRALADLRNGGEGGNAYRLYLWLVDRGCRYVPQTDTPPLARQCVRVRGYLAMRSMGYRELKA